MTISKRIWRAIYLACFILALISFSYSFRFSIFFENNVFRKSPPRLPTTDAAAAAAAAEVAVRITVTTAVPFDILVRTDAAGKSVVSDLMLAAHGYAPVESAVVEGVLRRACRASTPPPLVLDVGANLGYFTLLAAAHGCRVRAFEPSPRLAASVRASAALNGFGALVTVTNAGVGAAAGSLRFDAHAAEPALSRVVADEAATAHLPRVPVVALADEIAEDVLLIKMDTEGHEAAALAGLLPACAAHRIGNIVIEIKAPSAAAALQHLWACLDASAAHAALPPPTRGAWFHEWYDAGRIAAFAKDGLTADTPHGYLDRLQSPHAHGKEDAWFALADPAWVDAPDAAAAAAAAAAVAAYPVVTAFPSPSSVTLMAPLHPTAGSAAAAPPLLVDGSTFCLRELYYLLEQVPDVDDNKQFVTLPYATWNEAICVAKPTSCACPTGQRAGCATALPASAFALRPNCLGLEGGHPKVGSLLLGCAVDAPPCVVSQSIMDAAHAEGLLLSHTSLSVPWLMDVPAQRAAFLAPPERASRRQLWALSSGFESLSYYPAGGDPSILQHFDITAGSNRNLHGLYFMSYLPDWERIFRPFSLLDKLSQRIVPALSNVSLVISNCASRSEREPFLAELLALLPVDSFGKCLGNRDEPTVSSTVLGFHNGMEIKHSLAYGYKFLLAFENSIEYDYVTEKIFDAWEAHAVPVYRGAPNIADYAIGPHSYIAVDKATAPADLAALLAYLDKNDTAYAEYHAWRNTPRELIEHGSPLGRLVDFHRSQPTPLCALCAAVHARRRHEARLTR
jgi:FkbM family methyltransferase